jgi:hypothetical protein
MRRVSAAVAMALALPLLFASGCAGLIIESSDSAGAKIGKFTSRFLLGVTTLGYSERLMADEKHYRALKSFYSELDAGLGILTFDDAITTWGPPESRFDGDKIVIATWNSETTSEITTYYKKSKLREFVSSGWEMNLSFDKSTRKLTNWKFREW